MATPSPDAVTLPIAQRWCQEFESTLRNSYGEERKLPPENEAELAKFSTETLFGALNRWAYLKHLYRVRYAEVQRASSRTRPDIEDAETAARQLVRREPYKIVIADREIDVTGRSYAALYEIAAHWLRIQELEKALRSEKVPDLYRRLAYETILHRRAIWAHALTKDGAPAKSIDDAPDFWRQLTPQDDAMLLMALFEVMHRRYERLGPMPKAKKRKGEKDRENFGWHSLLMSLEAKAKVEPAAYYDKDLFQLVTRDRLAARSELEDSLEES